LLSLNEAAGFHFEGKGITLDGKLDEKTRLPELVHVFSHSPALRLEDLNLKNFTRAGINLVNCQGAKDHLAFVGNLKDENLPLEKKTTDKKLPLPPPLVLLEVNPLLKLPVNDFIEIGDVGPDPKKAIRLQNPKVVGSNVTWPTGME
jgi:hypothetical protein